MIAIDIFEFFQQLFSMSGCHDSFVSFRVQMKKADVKSVRAPAHFSFPIGTENNTKKAAGEGSLYILSRDRALCSELDRDQQVAFSRPLRAATSVGHVQVAH